MLSRPFSAAVFDPPPMACPGCYRALREPVPDCPDCGYNGWTCVEKFPWIPPPLQRVMDVEGCLSAAERAAIDRVAEPLEQAMPQVRVHLCLGQLHPDTDPREFGFWLFNASVPPDPEAAIHRPWSILLVIDRSSRRASITVGYGLDPFLGDDLLRLCLVAGIRDFSKGKYGDGAARCMAKLHQVLKRARKNAESAASAARFRQVAS